MAETGQTLSYQQLWEEIKNLRTQVARLEAELAEAQAVIERGGTVVFTGLSVPKRELDDAKAEYARKCQELAALRAQLREANENHFRAIERAERAEALAKKTRIAIGAHLRTAESQGWPCGIDDVLLEVLADAEALEQRGKNVGGEGPSG